MDGLDGVKVTPWLAVPTTGTVLDAVKEKEPVVLAAPPDSEALDNVWPYVMAAAVGAALIVGVALLTVTLADVVAVL